MTDVQRLIYLHGQDSSSQTYKAGLLRKIFPDLLVPDFIGSLDERMQQLYPMLGSATNWTLIGSSFGGLMAALFTTEHPTQVRKQILLAPALMLPEFAEHPPASVDVPTVVIHGRQDTVVPVDQVRPLAEKVFTNLEYRLVEDDHRLHQAADQLDWKSIIS